MARIIINLTVVYDFLAFIELCGLNRVVVDRRKANSDDDDFIKRPSIKLYIRLLRLTYLTRKVAMFTNHTSIPTNMVMRQAWIAR